VPLDQYLLFLNVYDLEGGGGERRKDDDELVYQEKELTETKTTAHTWKNKTCCWL
jgi:hypothetical protein